MRCLFILLLFTVFSLSAQDTLYSHHISVNWQNDLFLKTDKDFTNGLEISYMKSSKTRLKIPTRKVKGAVSVPSSYREYSLIQHIFTPENLGTDELIYNDRPYAGYLYLRIKGLEFSGEADFILSSSLDLGILGPWAYGGNIQDFIHDNTPSPAPEGWDNQIQNDLVLNYNFSFEKSLFNEKYFLLTVPSLLKLGTLYTNLSTGLKMQLGKFQDYFESPYNLSTDNDIQYYITAAGGIQFVFYNATLQGGVFSNENQHIISNSDITRWVYYSRIDFNFSFKRVLIKSGVQFSGKTYNFGESHRYGFISLGYSF